MLEEPSPRRINVSFSPYSVNFKNNAFNQSLLKTLLKKKKKVKTYIKHVRIYISHILGVVYEVCDETSTWPFQKERENIEVCFGVKTGQGLLEFKCKNKIHKQKWVDGIQHQLNRSICTEDTENSIRMLSINKSI